MKIRYLGRQEYETVYQAMCDFTDNRTSNTEDELWVLEHFPVFTLGKAGKIEHLLHKTDIPVVKTDRGGQITYHGPGQLIVYTMIDFSRKNISVHELVSSIELSIIKTLQDYAIVANKDDERPGVYVAGKKIASLGLRIRNNGAYHGLSLNVNMDLNPFHDINPCGYADLEMTQIKDLLSPCPSMDEVTQKLVQYLQIIL
ncbi:MAG: lipoyl(octanoyl) transferase LipB [Neisseriaceae bacterium]|nr:lipoyl(octanoyl) transferase LipB [Neisseriaceae bacterium]MCV2509409.1 lipoyl(octanoyl) transferase LipB [Neisseriaceae bacterium]